MESVITEQIAPPVDSRMLYGGLVRIHIANIFRLVPQLYHTIQNGLVGHLYQMFQI